MASAEMAHLRYDPLGASYCGSILSEACLLRFGPLGALSLRFDPFGGVSFAVWSVGGVVLRFDPFGGVSFAVQSLGGVVFAVRSVAGDRGQDKKQRNARTCKSCIQSENQERMEGAQRCPGRAARGTCWWQCQDALTG
jgi:hypothetical protein